MASQAGASGPAQASTPGAALPLKKPWGKIAAVALVVILIIAAFALLNRRPNRAPTVTQTTVNAPSPKAGDSITFVAQAADPDGDDLLYQWEFGDGTTGSGAQVNHAYGLPGEFLALLTVSDGKGGAATNDANLLSVHVEPKSSDIAPPAPCQTASCSPGPVVAVLDAAQPTTGTGTPVAFDGNLSWAYAFSWTNETNHTEGGTYSLLMANGNAALFALFRYTWGDGTSNTTGTSEMVGRTSHAFGATGLYFVRLTVTYANADLNPSTKSASAGYTVRVLASPLFSPVGIDRSPSVDAVIDAHRPLAVMAKGPSGGADRLSASAA